MTKRRRNTTTLGTVLSRSHTLRALHRQVVFYPRWLARTLASLLYRRGVALSVSRVAKSPTAQFVSRFRDQYVSTELIRVGPNGDGGYLMPDVAELLDATFSPGVGQSALFEADLWARANIPSFLADATVEPPNNLPPNALFRPFMVGASPDPNFVTLSEWVNSSVPESHKHLLLQMDIEGGEYNVLAYEDSHFLRRFAVIIIEFHAMRQVGDALSCGTVGGIFEKLYRDFAIVHAHPNNCCPSLRINGVLVPDVLEVTFLRRDLVAGFASPNPIRLPHPLDCPNVSRRSAPALSEAWWKSHSSEPVTKFS